MTRDGRRLLLLPVSLWAALFIAAPLAIIVAQSFAGRGPYGEVVWDFTLGNYRRAFSPAYGRVAWLSIRMAFANTLLCLAAGYPLAYLMAHVEGARWRNLLMVLILVPFWTNFLIRTYALGQVLGDEGLVNRLLVAAGLISEPLDLLYSKKAIVLGLLTNYLPFMVLPLYVSLEKLDRNLLEAAKDLGASPFRAFLRVTWPLSLPGVAAGSLIVFIPSLGEFIVPDLLGGGRYLLLGNLLQQKYLVTRDWPVGSALAVLLAGTLLGLMALALRRKEGAARA